MKWDSKARFIRHIRAERAKQAAINAFESIVIYTPQQASALISMEIIEKYTTDNNLEFFNEYLDGFDLPAYFYEQFIRFEEEILFAKKADIPDDARDYEMYIERLKRNADELQKLSASQIEIRLPSRIGDTLRVMALHFRECDIPEEVTTYCLEYFGKPKITRPTTALKNKIEKFKSGLNSHEIRYYTPSNS